MMSLCPHLILLQQCCLVQGTLPMCSIQIFLAIWTRVSESYQHFIFLGCEISHKPIEKFWENICHKFND